MKIQDFFFLGCCLVSSLHADEAKLRQELQDGVDEKGRVTDQRLVKRTGWRTVRAFEWWVELEDADNKGRYKPADASRLFHQGERIKIRVKAYCDLYVYILNRNADGSEVVLVPQQPTEDKTEATPLVKRGNSLTLPDDGTALCFTPPAGKEQFRILVSPEELPFVTSESLFKVKNGDKLNKQQQAALNQLKDIRKKAFADIEKNQKDLLVVKSIDASVKAMDGGKLTKGAMVVAVEPTAQGRLVTLTSPDADSKAILVHEIVLQHAK